MTRGNYQKVTKRGASMVEHETDVNMKKVKEFMFGQGYSEYKLSGLMGVSYSYVYRVMKGTRPPGKAFISGLIKAGMQPNEIFLPASLPKCNSNN
jgi:hypothetical protein